MLARFARLIVLMLVIFVAGCSVHQTSSEYTLRQLNHVTPQYIAVNHGRMEYYRFGRGTPIILINGYVTDISSWNRQFLATLADHHDIIVINNRNVGGSTIRSGRYTTQDLANDTYQVIEQLHLKKPAILGISMGGMIAQQVAALHQDKLGHLILINTAIAGKKSVHPKPTTEKLMLNMPTDKVGRYFLAIKLFFPSHDRLPMAISLAIDRFQPRYFTEVDAPAMLAPQRSLLMHWTNDDATAEKLSTLKLPTLILNGQFDDVIPPVNSVILARTIPHATLERWPYGGHAMIFQYPAELAQAVNEFLA